MIEFVTPAKVTEGNAEPGVQEANPRQLDTGFRRYDGNFIRHRARTIRAKSKRPALQGVWILTPMAHPLEMRVFIGLQPASAF